MVHLQYPPKMIQQEGTTPAKMESPMDSDGTRALPVLDTRRLSLAPRDDHQHYYPHSPTTPMLLCRVLGGTHEQPCSFYVQYLAEGAANVVFKMHPWFSDAPRRPLVFCPGADQEELYDRSNFDGKVLRISKGHAKTGSSEAIMEGYEKMIRPLFDNSNAEPRPEFSISTFYLSPEERAAVAEDFSEHLMNYEPVVLTMDVVAELTSEIDEQSLRKENLSIPIEQKIGILLPDMSSRPGESVTIEIKPKWLQQSPNAPRDAFRCRTCALEASRTDKNRQSIYICPLQLAAGNAPLIHSFIRLRVEKEVSRFAPALRPRAAQIDDIVARITTYLTTGKGHKLLHRLRRIQMQLDPEGILKYDLKDPVAEANLALAMTLRDCSMFIRVDYGPARGGIECKLGDLDAKAATKLGDWDDKEKVLIHEGWYTQIDVGEAEFRHEHCLISAGWKEHAPRYF